MGVLKGRRQPVKGFSQRAAAFDGDLARGRGFRAIERDGKKILVGTGRHKGFMRKPKHSNFSAIYPFLRAIEESLLEREKNQKTRPSTYALVPLRAVPELNIQQYVDRPTLGQFLAYLETKRGRHEKPLLSQEEIALCRRFERLNKGISLADLGGVKEELRKDIINATPEEMLFDYHFTLKNILLLGQRRTEKDRRLIVALADI